MNRKYIYTLRDDPERITWRIPGSSVPHVLLLATQGVQRKISIKPPPRIRAIMARIVHTVEAEVTRADNSLLAAGKSTTSSVPRPNLLALPSKNLRRRDAFSQDILAGPPILFPIIVLSKTFSKLRSLQRYLSLRSKVFSHHHLPTFPYLWKINFSLSSTTKRVDIDVPFKISRCLPRCKLLFTRVNFGGFPAETTR